MDYPSHYSRFDRFSLWLLTRSAWKQSLLGASACLLICTIAMSFVIFIFASPNAKFTSIMILIFFSVVVPTVVSGLLFPAVLKLNDDRLTRLFGFLPTPREQIDLRIWFTNGTLPKSARLINVLPRYLDMIKSIAVDGRLYKNQWLNKLIFASFILWIVTTVIRFITATQSLFDYFAFVAYIVLALITLPFPFKNGNPFTRVFMSRTYKNYQARRKELS